MSIAVCLLTLMFEFYIILHVFKYSFDFFEPFKNVKFILQLKGHSLQIPALDK